MPRGFVHLNGVFSKENRLAESADGRFAAHCTPRCRAHGTEGARDRKPPCGKFRRPIYGVLCPTLPRAWYGRRTRDKARRQLRGNSEQRAYTTGRDGSFAKALYGGNRNRTRRQTDQKSHPPPHNIAHSPKPHIIDTVQKTAYVPNKTRPMSAIPQIAFSTAAPRRSTRGGCLSFSFPSQTNYFLSTKTE